MDMRRCGESSVSTEYRKSVSLFVAVRSELFWAVVGTEKEILCCVGSATKVCWEGEWERWGFLKIGNWREVEEGSSTLMISSLFEGFYESGYQYQPNGRVMLMMKNKQWALLIRKCVYLNFNITSCYFVFPSKFHDQIPKVHVLFITWYKMDTRQTLKMQRLHIIGPSIVVNDLQTKHPTTR